MKISCSHLFQLRNRRHGCRHRWLPLTMQGCLASYQRTTASTFARCFSKTWSKALYRSIVVAHSQAQPQEQHSCQQLVLACLTANEQLSQNTATSRRRGCTFYFALLRHHSIRRVTWPGNTATCAQMFVIVSLAWTFALHDCLLCMNVCFASIGERYIADPSHPQPSHPYFPQPWTPSHQPRTLPRKTGSNRSRSRLRNLAGGLPKPPQSQFQQDRLNSSSSANCY